jgi:hypothetical protein
MIHSFFVSFPGIILRLLASLQGVKDRHLKVTRVHDGFVEARRSIIV